MSKGFPWIMPKTKPDDRKISAAMSRLYDIYGPRGDNENEFYSIFNPHSNSCRAF
ncbi:hypothetical protein [Clostridium grantii]|uniref:Uncharacterized protein n=1 Tax=Clostridium grantii DSM 8605 TaxID=1121316 RepID=A0A1M5VEB0_9CLOT|nr:hypothetical protein [Clostridium grantii]SHH73602.1 hypothetical protein SAMN02745207_02249 [Clostridium grantii DSM 8605]